MKNLKPLGALLIGLALGLGLILVLVKADIDAKNVFLCDAVSSEGLDMEQCPAHTSNSSWLLILGFIVSGVLLVAGASLLLAGNPFLKSPARPRPGNLDTEEKGIVEYLSTHEGSGYQGDLIRETGFSKVKVTRILDRLEQKGIIERRRRGMANLVVLK